MTKKRKLNLKEQDQLQALKEENRKLKRDISKLRKQLDRLDLDGDRYANLAELVNKQYKEEKAAKKVKKLKEQWGCYQCGQGVLKLIIFNRADGPVYFRQCNNCDNRTKLQRYTSKVDGVKNE